MVTGEQDSTYQYEKYERSGNVIGLKVVYAREVDSLKERLKKQFPTFYWLLPPQM